MPKTFILTTETTHHLYYLWKLSELCSIHGVVIETDTLKCSPLKQLTNTSKTAMNTKRRIKKWSLINRRNFATIVFRQ